MDAPFFNPNENEDQITPWAQDISLNLNSLSQNQGNDYFKSTPSDSPQIQTPQLINDNDKSKDKVKKGKIYLFDLNTFCIPFKEFMDKYFPVFMFCFGAPYAIMGIFGLIFCNNIDKGIEVSVGFIIGGIIFIAVSFMINYTDYHTVYFIMEESSLTVVLKYIFRKKEIIYNSGEIKKVKFTKTKKMKQDIHIN